MLLAAGMLAFSAAGSLAQQNKGPDNGAALKSTTSGRPDTAATAGAVTSNDTRSHMSSTNGSALKTTTMGDTGRETKSHVSPPAGRSTTSSENRHQ
ncbi:hypothetical protein CCS01_09855 [Rhodopila globiformis]|uniref:Uncharacterized protein n=2 Tax=Rhodopila globiformis TaxID=1071 RepID=A0A2S6NJ44_RHOGL|nr:hypothetical protein CCS01_09855 [Rhodopila globiformis]